MRSWSSLSKLTKKIRPPDPTETLSRHDRASEQDDWDCVDELVDEETFSQAVAS